jgi:hypothetical protein
MSQRQTEYQSQPTPVPESNPGGISYQPCPSHPRMLLPMAAREVERLRCPICAQTARAASYARQRADFEATRRQAGVTRPAPGPCLGAAREGTDGLTGPIPSRCGEITLQMRV